MIQVFLTSEKSHEHAATQIGKDREKKKQQVRICTQLLLFLLKF